VRASQTVYPPSKTSSSTTAEPKSGSIFASFDSSSNLVASKLEDATSTIWIWDIAAAELRAVLIFHGNVTSFRWHPHIRELLLITCDGDDYSGLVFTWDPLSGGPNAANLAEHSPAKKVVGKTYATWLNHKLDTATMYLRDSNHSLLVMLVDEGQSPIPWRHAEISDVPAGICTIDSPEGVDIDRSLAAMIDEDASEMDDTFSFKRA
jgi:hypothetical protein